MTDSDFDRIEEHRDLTAGLEYEDRRDRAMWDYEVEEGGVLAYELDDPKHPRHHDVFADLADMDDAA